MQITFQNSEHWDILIIRTKSIINKGYIISSIEKYLEHKNIQPESVNIIGIDTVLDSMEYTTSIKFTYTIAEATDEIV